ncbi:MAG: hypothetical protein NZL85_05450 [Fimbriimonadales bacterium]|nr:hypothetical protein [Fimbriimonadales bacterium]
MMLMKTKLVDEMYQQVCQRLSAKERLELAERILHEWLERAAQTGRFDWRRLQGIAPNLLGGEDAQEWVSRTRHEADEHRERQWRRD